jgi:hypothetical protein
MVGGVRGDVMCCVPIFEGTDELREPMLRNRCVDRTW